MPQKNNHEIYTSLMDKSDGKGCDGVMNPDLQAKSDTGAVAVDTTALKKRIDANDQALSKADNSHYAKGLKTILAQTDTLEAARGNGSELRKLPEYKNKPIPNVKAK